MTIPTKLYWLLVAARPRQWLKNLSVFAAVFFGGRLLEASTTSQVIATFLIFCTLSSSMYLINDLVDIQADKAHFSKKDRPISKGLISKNFALLAAGLFSAIGLIGAFALNPTIFFTCLTFIAVQLAYTFFLKGVIILDILAIAFTFMLRVFAGSFVINEPLSSWLILTVMMLAIFLAVGKRRSELTLLNYRQAVEHRHILSHYPPIFLDGITFMMAASTLLTYSLFSFNTSRSLSLLSGYLPTTLANPRWLMITIPIVIYGVFRYLYLVFDKKEGESPEKVLLSDFPLFVSVCLWGLTAFLIIYVFNA